MFMRRKKGSRYQKFTVITLCLLLFIGGFVWFQAKYPINWGTIFYFGSGEPELSQTVTIERQVQGMLVQAKMDDALWASQGNTLFKSLDEGESWKEMGTLSYPIYNIYYLTRFPIVRRIFGKRGVQDIKILKSGTVLVHGARGSHLWRSVDGGMTFEKVHQKMRHSFLSQGWTEKDGIVFYGEYAPNPNYEEMHIWKSTDDGKNWSIVYTFPAGSIRHIHAVQYDPYGDKLWVGTGDRDPECRIMYSEDDGNSFKTIGQGSQEWRAVSLLFTERYVYWGMDCNIRQCYILRWDRKTEATEIVQEIDGPAYFSTKLRNGTLVIATTVEYSPSEWDKSADIWIKRKDNEHWEDIGKWERLQWTSYRHYGLLILAHPNQSSYLYLSPLNTKGHYSLFKLKIDEVSKGAE